MTAAETLVRVDEQKKGHLEQAWHIALLHHLDGKRFPRSPEALWKKVDGAPVMSDTTIVALAKAMEASKQNEKRRAEKKRLRAEKLKQKPSEKK